MLRTKIFVSFFFFIALASSAWAWNSGDWLISFSEPSGWRVYECDKVSCMFMPRDKRAYYSIIAVAAEHKGLNQDNADIYRAAFIQVAENKEKVEIISEQLVTLNGRQAMKYICQYPVSRQKTIVYSTVNNRKWYLFEMRTRQNFFDEFAPGFEQFMETVRFLNP